MFPQRLVAQDASTSLVWFRDAPVYEAQGLVGFHGYVNEAEYSWQDVNVPDFQQDFIPDSALFNIPIGALDLPFPP